MNSYNKLMNYNFNSIFKNVIQVGIIVSNLKKTLEKYSKGYGIGPWYVKKYSGDNVKDMYLYEKRKNYSMNLAFCSIGNVQFELIEPISSSIYTEFYDKYGEGVIHHLKMEVQDYESALCFFKLNGIKVIMSGNHMGRKYSYLSTSNDIGFITEIASAPTDFARPEPDYWYPESKILSE